MADEVRTYTILIPANTPANAMLTTDTSFPVRIVEGVEIVFPRGLNGSVGVQILNSNMQAIPANNGGFIIGSDEPIKWPLENQITSGSWQVRAFNTGRYPHTIFIRYLLKYPDLLAGAATVPLIPNSAFSGNAGPDLSLLLSQPADLADGAA